MATRFWYINCPVCQQGRLFVQRRTDTGDLMLECEECSAAWSDPSRAAARVDGFVGIEISTDDATRAEIEAAGWAGHQFHRVDK